MCVSGGAGDGDVFRAVEAICSNVAKYMLLLFFLFGC